MIMSFGEAGDGTSCNIGTNDMCIGGICRVRIFFYPRNIFLITIKNNYNRKWDAIGLLTQIQRKIYVEFALEMEKLVTQLKENSPRK